jgi:hypothetical protein
VCGIMVPHRLVQGLHTLVYVSATVVHGLEASILPTLLQRAPRAASHRLASFEKWWPSTRPLPGNCLTSSGKGGPTAKLMAKLGSLSLESSVAMALGTPGKR